MPRPISFAITRDERTLGYEYVIGGTPLGERLRKHERIQDSLHTALGNTPGTRARLLLEAPSDLIEGATALYTCPVCGGYDGDLIGAVIRIEDDRIIWDRIGIYCDDEELGPSRPFERVTSFTFDILEYREALRPIPVS